jgi:hypothetical protein
MFELAEFGPLGIRVKFAKDDPAADIADQLYVVSIAKHGHGVFDPHSSALAEDARFQDRPLYGLTQEVAG